MKNWKIIVMLVAGLGLSACLELRNPDEFKLSYRKFADHDTLSIVWNAKDNFKNCQELNYTCNGKDSTTLAGRKALVASINSMCLWNPDGCRVAGIYHNTRCTLSDDEVATCVLDFSNWNGGFPEQYANAHQQFAFPIRINNTTPGFTEQTLYVLTPVLDLSKAVHQPYYKVVSRELDSLADVQLNEDAVASFDGGFVAPEEELAPEEPAAPLDTDSDGTPDASDNCPFVDNEDQADQDEDLIGNTCDPAPSVPDENFLRNEHGDEDYEGDGVLNSTDNCIYTSNEDQADLDNDGVGSICDETEPVVEGCRDNLSKNSLSVYAAADGCLGKDNSGANFGVFGPMSSSDGGFCALNPHSSTNFAPFAALFVGLSCLIARRRYE